jgi:hypothetical protein
LALAPPKLIFLSSRFSSPCYTHAVEFRFNVRFSLFVFSARRTDDGGNPETGLRAIKLTSSTLAYLVVGVMPSVLLNPNTTCISTATPRRTLDDVASTWHCSAAPALLFLSATALLIGIFGARACLPNPSWFTALPSCCALDSASAPSVDTRVTPRGPSHLHRVVHHVWLQPSCYLPHSSPNFVPSSSSTWPSVPLPRNVRRNNNPNRPALVSLECAVFCRRVLVTSCSRTANPNFHRPSNTRPRATAPTVVFVVFFATFVVALVHPHAYLAPSLCWDYRRPLALPQRHLAWTRSQDSSQKQVYSCFCSNQSVLSHSDSGFVLFAPTFAASCCRLEKSCRGLPTLHPPRG